MADIIDTLANSSPIRTYMDNYHSMRVSHDADRSDPKDVASLRRRWAKAVFRTMHNKPGFCSVCQEQIASALDVHMINVHLDLGQLWRCPVEWCAVWKGSVSDCL